MKTLIAILIFPLIYFIEILIKKKVIRFGIIDTSRVGHMTSPFICYLIRKKHENKKNFDFLFRTKKIANSFLYKKIYHDYFIIKFEKIFNILDFSYQFYFKKSLNNINLNIDELDKIKNIKNLINFTDAEKKIALNKLKEIGLNNNDKWICIHNRDDLYLKNYFPKHNWDYHNHRDFHPNDFNKSINLMINQGYFVFRMGKVTKETINFQNNKFIDFSRLETSSKELLEIYLLSNASFYFGSDSGIFTVAMIGKRPFSFINFPSITSMFKYYHWSLFPYIFQMRKSKKTNKYFTLNEIFQLNLDNIHDGKIFKKESIQLINNSQEEIHDLCLETIQRINGNFEQTDKQKDLQKKFNEICLKYIPIDKKIKTYPVVGSKFLEKYSEYIN